MRLLLTLLLLTVISSLHGQSSVWPKTINNPKAKIVIYQPQPETFEGKILTGRAAIAVTQAKQKEPIFGAVWFNSTVETDKVNRIVTIQSIKIPEIKFPGETDDAAIAELKNAILEDAKLVSGYFTGSVVGNS
ncbi:MAG: hypothetical protein ACK4IY_02885 [Chitinophagales bacterium]